ncbi:MAG: UDP-N-acetylmuramoyl-L-alanyl-D-glutamate--2,6-diaminopimelate ligase [Bacteroidetes bacterium]|nr:UDP-N-acetylmuramoyl-L-alanyl-D-glutamate--2,6-diaminopimelate ligase [Bacteroidota bacterium]
MKPLNDILRGIKILNQVGPAPRQVSRIVFDSRVIEQDCMFVAVKGTMQDGHKYIDQTIQSGATTIVCEQIPEKPVSNITYIQVADSSQVLGIMASNWFDNPSSRLKLVGITGTNGKTTTVTLLHQLFRKLGYHVGVLSTIKNKIDEEEIPSTHTTPDAIQLNELLHRMVEMGCTHCFMEVSSHSVVQNRIAGLRFTGGIFSNLTHDHLDFHKTFDEYLKAKKRFFDELPAESFALTNIDDRNGRVMIQNTRAIKKTYSLRSLADFKGKILETPLDGLHLDIDGNDTWCRLVGKFNGYNLMAVYAAAVLLGEPSDEVLMVLSGLGSVEGRFDYIKSSEGTIGIVDYAHTPDALQNVLDTISELRTGNEVLITVVGCGGDRDRTKRPVMAQIACNMSDKVILTSDNPRSENPEAIISEMMTGVKADQKNKVLAITDRHEAIRTACMVARPGDVILVAGKGHEKYQDIAGVKHAFDDKKVLTELIN